MSPTRSNRMLGLAIGERAALVAEVSLGGGGRLTVDRVAEFAYPSGTSLARPDVVGAALGPFLRLQGFAARAAVIGIPGKWVLTKRMEAPPAEPQLVADTLRLQAEGEFGADAGGGGGGGGGGVGGGGGDFAFDYAGQASASSPRPVLLMAIPRRQLGQVTALAAAARLRAAAVVPFAAALGAAAARVSKDARVLLLGPAGAEFVAQGNGHPHVMRYLGPASAPTAFLAGELRRAAAGTSSGGGDGGAGAGTGAAGLASGAPSGNGTPRAPLLVWNDARLDPASLEAFGVTLGSPLTLGDPRALGAAAAEGVDAPPGYAAAVALAVAGLEAGRDPARALPVDFLHSRLTPPRPVRVRRRTLVIAAAATAAVGLTTLAVLDLGRMRSHLADTEAAIKASEGGSKAARASVARGRFAEPWHGTDPVFVACLHDVTAAIPEDGRTFLTGFTLDDAMKGTLTGKSANSGDVFEMLDRLAASGRFADLKPSYETPRPATKAPGGAQRPPGPPGGAPQMPPGGMPPGMPPGAMPPGAMPPGAMPPGAMPSGAMPPGAMPGAPPGAAGGASPGADPAMAMAMAQAQMNAMAQAQAQAMAQGQGPRPGPGGPPGPGPGGPGVAPPGGPPPGAGGPPGGASGAGGNEVTFSVTFNYVPRPKQRT